MTPYLVITLLVLPTLVSGLPTQKENEIEIVVKAINANKDTSKDIYPKTHLVAVPAYFPGLLQDRVLLLRIAIVDTIADLNLFATVILGEDPTTSDDVRDNLGAVLAVLDSIAKSIEHNQVDLVTIGRVSYQQKLNHLFETGIFDCSIKAIRKDLFPLYVQRLREIAGIHADTWLDILKDAANGTAEIVSLYNLLPLEGIAERLDLADLALRMTKYIWRRFSMYICRTVRVHTEDLVPTSAEEVDEVSTPGTEILDDDTVVTESASINTENKEILREVLKERCPDAVTNYDLQTCLLATLFKEVM